MTLLDGTVQDVYCLKHCAVLLIKKLGTVNFFNKSSSSFPNRIGDLGFHKFTKPEKVKDDSLPQFSLNSKTVNRFCNLVKFLNSRTFDFINS